MMQPFVLASGRCLAACELEIDELVLQDRQRLR
jgi:hypothetical protein